MQQRRRWERYRKTLDVVIHADDGRTIRARTQDLCEGGLGIVCDEPLAAGSYYRFAIAEIDDAPLAGEVRWCTASASLGGNLIGVELTALSAKQTEALADRIARWRAEDAARGDA